jgi:hypothetical protein
LNDGQRIKREIENEISKMEKMRRDVKEELNQIVPFKIWGKPSEVKKLGENQMEVERLRSLYILISYYVHRDGRKKIEEMEKEEEEARDEFEKELHIMHYKLVLLKCKENVMITKKKIKKGILNEKGEKKLIEISEMRKRLISKEKEMNMDIIRKRRDK